MSLTSDADAASGVVELLGGFPNQSVEESGVLFFPTGHDSRTSAHHTRNFHYRHARSGKPQSGRDLLFGPIAFYSPVQNKNFTSIRPSYGLAVLEVNQAS